MNQLTLFDDYYHDLGIFLYLSPIISAFWAAFALLAYKHHSRSQKYLAICLIALGIGMAFSFWYDRYTATDRTEILRAINPLCSIFCAITTLFYFTSLVNPGKLTRRYRIGHIAAAVLFSAFILFLEVYLGNIRYTLNWEVIRANPTHPAVVIRLIALFGLLVFEGYTTIVCLRMYFRHRQFIREVYSYEENINLNWIGSFIIFFAAFAIADLLWMTNSAIFFKILFGVLSCTVIILLFWFGFRQEEVPTEEVYIREEEAVTASSPDQSEANIIEHPGNHNGSHKQEKIKEELLVYFNNEKPFLNPELNLEDVARALRTNRTYLSQLINREFGINFYTFVSQYRIRYVVELIQEDHGKELTPALVFDKSGFKSRSVFYKQFREITGYSPSDYINISS